MERTETMQNVLTAFDQDTYVREVPQTVKSPKRRIGFFTGNERHQIRLEDGIQYAKNYRRSDMKSGTSGAYFGREIVNKILQQERCVGIRIYYANNSDGTPTRIITGAETNNADQYRGILGVENRSFAKWSPDPNPLNSDSSDRTDFANNNTKIFTGNENHFVTLAEATQLVRNYQRTIEHGDYKAMFFGSAIFRKILAQEGCAGIHMYHALHDDGVPSFVLVGLDEYGFDILRGVVGQMALPCPRLCDYFSPLNSPL